MTSEGRRVSSFPPRGVNRVLEATHDFYYERFTREASAREQRAAATHSAARNCGRGEPRDSPFVTLTGSFNAHDFEMSMDQKVNKRKCCWQTWEMFWRQVWQFVCQCRHFKTSSNCHFQWRISVSFFCRYIFCLLFIYLFIYCAVSFFVSGLFFTPLVTFVNLNQIVTTSVSSLLSVDSFPLVASHVRSVFHRSSSEFQVYKDWLSVWTFVACKRRICRNSALRSCSVCFCPSVRIKSVHI